MTWSEGDIWSVDLQTDLNPGDTLQYKYIVSNPDGDVDAWKPGDDIVLEVPDEASGDNDELRILDTWDGDVHDVVVESAEGGDIPREAEGDDVLTSALQRSYAELERKLNAAQNLLDTMSDPGAAEMVLADRELAIAANKASALKKVVEAAEQAINLKNQDR